jgi:GT2 family glycosyltransferase
MKRRHPNVQIISFDKNYGFAEAYNKALFMVDSEYVAILNNDTETKAGWLRELVNAIETDPTVAACGSKILLDSDEGTLNHAGGAITILGGGFDVGYKSKDSYRYDRRRFAGYACGASMLVRRDVFLRIGGFDKDFFSYAEDVDFCWRAWLYGYKVIYVPTSVVYHRFGATAGPMSSPFRVFMAEKNRNVSALKNFERRHVIRALLLGVIYNIARIVVFLRHRNCLGVAAIFRADLFVIKDLRSTWWKRKPIQEHRLITDTSLEKTGLIASLAESMKEFARPERWTGD